MKKLFYYIGFPLMALGATACDGYEEPNPPAQSNPQGQIISVEDIASTNDLTNEVYNLEELNDTHARIDVATVTSHQIPEGYTLGALTQISFSPLSEAQAADEVWYNIASELRNNENDTYTLTINPDDVDGIYKNNVSTLEDDAKATVRFVLTLSKGTEIAYVNGENSYTSNLSFTFTPMPVIFTTEEAYYLIGTVSDWNFEGVKKFSGGDNGIFTLNVTISEEEAEAGWWWKVIPESTVAYGEWSPVNFSQFGPVENGDESLSGSMIGKIGSIEPGAGCIKEAGKFILTINMASEESLSYSFEAAPESDFLWTPGDANGWAPEESQRLFGTDKDGFKGFARLSPNGFKFISQPDWKGINYGFVAEATQGENGFWNGKLSDDGGADNLTVPALGLWYCFVNTTKLTYQVYQVNTIGLIGDATPDGWNSSTALTPSDDMLIWTGTVHLKAGEYKFRCNDAWDVSIGGEAADLQFVNDNVSFTGEEGDYDVTLNLGILPYSCTLVKK